MFQRTRRTDFAALMSVVGLSVLLLSPPGSTADRAAGHFGVQMPAGSGSKPEYRASVPVWDYLQHDVGTVVPRVWNDGTISYFEFPRGSGLQYLQISRPIFGAVLGADTLVTNGAHMLAETFSYEPLKLTTNRIGDTKYDPDAVADQQFVAVFSDTSVSNSQTVDYIELRKHKPIGLEFHQTSYSWSAGFGASFIIVDSWIKNISLHAIGSGYVGLHVNSAVLYNPLEHEDPGTNDTGDDIVGFLGVVPGISKGSLDTINVAWNADNDGNPSAPRTSFARSSPTGVMGVRVLRVPQGGRYSFNWWAHYGGLATPYNWGPSKREHRVGHGGSVGLPIGDRGNYATMSNGETDYDQPFSAIDFQNQGWSPPPPDAQFAALLAEGAEVHYILSYGPLPTLLPGDSVPLTVAFIGGARFHRYPSNPFWAASPGEYMGRLDFSDLIRNARWADWVFDNPGVDTDGDGNRGRAYLVDCNDNGCDSVFYKGDGIPDFRGPSPPPAPRIDVTTEPSRVVLRWHGAMTEGYTNPFSMTRNFEGYRVYLGLHDRDDDFSLVATWDKEDFNRFAFDARAGQWSQISYPSTAAEWRAILSDNQFDPLAYSVPSLNSAYRDTILDTTRNAAGEILSIEWRERYSYWSPEGPNRGNDYTDSGQQETNAIQRVGERDTVIAGTPLTYGVYELHLAGLNPGIPMFCAVTALDFGDYRSAADPMESPAAANSHYFEPIFSSDVVMDSGLQVKVFPNPYKERYPDARGKNTTYYREGYEGRSTEEFSEQDRRIHFINLPDTATIRIWSLDGDLIREIHHPDPFLTTYSSSVGWDLISRNTQAVVSGIYIWRVDSKLGSQVGKLVIIK